MTTFSKRLATLRAVLPTTDLSHIERAEDDSPANWRETMAQMATNVSPELRERLAFVHALADVTDDDVALVGAFSRMMVVNMIRNVQFDEIEAPASAADVQLLEKELGVQLPDSLVWPFTSANGIASYRLGLRIEWHNEGGGTPKNVSHFSPGAIAKSVRRGGMACTGTR